MAITDLRAILAAAHYNMATDILAQSCDIYQSSNRSVAFASSVACIRRDPTRAEAALAVGYGLIYDSVFEVSLQANLAAALIQEIRPKIFYIRYGGVDWEILNITNDVLDVMSSGESTPAVLVLGCARQQDGGVGEIVGA